MEKQRCGLLWIAFDASSWLEWSRAQPAADLGKEGQTKDKVVGRWRQEILISP